MSINNADNRSSTKVSKSSNYLSAEENELVFRLVGRRSVSQCSTVAQLFVTEGPSHSRWIKKYTGALCFIKDNAKRSYYCRMYCLMRHEMVWEHEMYDTIDIARTRPYLLTFEGQDGIVALNFAFEDEAETFLHCAKTTVANRNRRREERRARGTTRKDPPARPPPITNNNSFNNKDDGAVTLRNPASITKLAPPEIQPSYQQQQSIFSNSRKQKRDGVKKLTKADIGTPSNFKHVTHVGWNAKSGFDLSGEDEALRPFLAKAGVSERELKNRETREFIYDFIQSNKVTEAVQKEKNKPAAPPVPTRNQNQNGEREKPAHRVAPPPPPPPKDFTEPQRPQRERQPAPPLPTSTPPVRNTPTRPPPVQQQSTTAPPPPPPPPMMPPPPPMPVNLNDSVVDKPSGPRLPVVPDTRNALMDSIRKGAQLKKVEVSSTASNSSGDSRTDLMSEIQRGIELRPVTDRPTANRSSGDGAGTDALANALRRALELRNRAVNGESSSEESDQNSDDGEWSD